MSSVIEITNGKEALGEALGRVTSGVYIITAETKTEKVGMLASWVQQVGFQPPTLSAAIAADREIYKAIAQSGRMTVNVISKENHALMKAFGKYSPNQFDEVPWSSTYCGLRLHDAVAYMDCVVKTRMEGVCDHVLLLAEVVEGAIQHRQLEPMAHLRKSGFHY